MYGPTYEIKLELNKEYDIPYGYGSNGYMYHKGEFLGKLEQHVSYWKENNFLVFKLQDKNGYAICKPNLSLLGHKLHITFDPKSFGKTLEETLEELNPKYKWETFCSDTEEKDYPELGQFKKL